MRKYFSFLIVAVMVVAAAMSSCEGEQGLPGEQGPAGPQGPMGPQGPAVTITINEDGFWVINGTVTTVKAVGSTPVITINDDGYWVINGVATTVKATGEQGPIATVIINDDGYWVINGVVTTVKATGPAGPQGAPGQMPTITISDDGYWVINGVKTDVKATYSGDGGGDPLGSTELVVAMMPAKTNYNVGEAFSATGLVIGVKYKEAIIPMNQFVLMWNNAVLTDGNTAITAVAGEKTVEVVDIIGRTTSFEITVVNPTCDICGEYPCECEPGEEVVVQFDKAMFRRWNGGGIPYQALSGWDIENAWDGRVAGMHIQLSGDESYGQEFQNHATPGFLSPGGQNVAANPWNFTFDAGQLGKVEKIKLYPREEGQQLFTNTHPKKIKIYASPTPDGLTADVSTWLYLGEFNSVRPSGLTDGNAPNTGFSSPQIDRNHARAGEDFIATENTDVAVRYFRFQVLETWQVLANPSTSHTVAFMEIEIFGILVK